uniref:Uncharacterized protein n=1 Tax=Trichuris muris TaxID=70415 RepID=A0A5S6QZI2_TRIMR
MPMLALLSLVTYNHVRDVGMRGRSRESATRSTQSPIHDQSRLAATSAFSFISARLEFASAFPGVDVGVAASTLYARGRLASLLERTTAFRLNELLEFLGIFHTALCRSPSLPHHHPCVQFLTAWFDKGQRD